MISKMTSLLIVALTTSILAGQASLAFGQRLNLDTQIESPPRNNNALELPEKKAGDTIQFQLFAPGAAGRQIQGYTIELALRGKTFGSYVDDVAGTDLSGSALLSRVSGSGNPTLSMLSLNAVAIPATGYLGQINLSVSGALTSSDALVVQSASTAGPGGVQSLDVSRASLTFSVGQRLRLELDAQIESPARDNNVVTLPEKRAGDTIQFQLFVPGAAGGQIQGYTVELALRGKTFDNYVDDVSGADLNSSALLSRVSATGNPTLSMLSLSSVAVPASGYLGEVSLSVSRALTSSDALSVPSASIAGAGGLQNLDVSQASLSFTATAQCHGDFDDDGRVDFADFIAFASVFGAHSSDANYDARMDIDGSGAVDFADFIQFAQAFGTPCPT